MVRNIDKVNGILIQKVTHNGTGKVLRYQIIPDGMVGKEQAKSFGTLWQARGYCTEVAPKAEATA